jgi:Ulp1 family protease
MLDPLTAGEHRMYTSLMARRPFFRVTDIDMIATTLERYQDGRWFNDEIINSYVEVLTRKYPHCVIQNTFMYGQVATLGINSVARWFVRRPMTANTQYLMFPVNISNVHWVVTCYDVQNNIVRLYDPMGAFPTAARRIQNIRTIYRRWAGLAEDPPVQDMDPRIQSDGYNCGVYTCGILECICRGLPINTLRGPLIRNYRYRILVNTYKSRCAINSSKRCVLMARGGQRRCKLRSCSNIGRCHVHAHLPLPPDSDSDEVETV